MSGWPPSGPSAASVSGSRLKTLRFEDRLGVGARGQVWSAVTPEGKRVAVKAVMRDDEDTGIEVAALNRVLPHGNIVSLLVSSLRTARRVNILCA